MYETVHASSVDTGRGIALAFADSFLGARREPENQLVMLGPLMLKEMICASTFVFVDRRR